MYLSSIFLFWWILHVRLQKNVRSIVVGWSSRKRSVRPQSFQSQVQAFYTPLTFPLPPSTYVIPGKTGDFFIFLLFLRKFCFSYFAVLLLYLPACLGFYQPAGECALVLLGNVSVTRQFPCPETQFSGTSAAITLSCLLLVRRTFFNPDGFKPSANNWVLLFQPVCLLCRPYRKTH